MDPSHAHLALNHVPVFGTVLGLGLLLLSLFHKHDRLRRASLEVLVVVALSAIAVFVTGTAATIQSQARPGVSAALVERHLDRALLASVFLWVTGAIAWLGLWQSRRNSPPRRWIVPVVLLFTTLTVALMASAANMGGEISHPEIRYGEAATATAWLSSRSLETLMREHRSWIWPLNEILHFIGLCLLFGVVLLINLRMLGAIKNVSFAAVHSLLPLAVLGFGINLVSGLLFLIGIPAQYVADGTVFFWKIGLMVLAGLSALFFTVYDHSEALGPEEEAPLMAKAMAVSSLVLWAGVAYCGRMLPFLGYGF